MNGNDEGGSNASRDTGSEFEEVEVEVEVDEDEEEEQAAEEPVQNVATQQRGASSSHAEPSDSAQAHSSSPATAPPALPTEETAMAADSRPAGSPSTPQSTMTGAADQQAHTHGSSPAEAANAQSTGVSTEFDAIDSAVKTFVGDIQSKFSAWSGLGTDAVGAGSMASSLGAFFGGGASTTQRDSRAAEQKLANATSAEGTLRERFGLSMHESIVDEMPCKLQQTYACSHNSHTPPIQMLFGGTLSITDKHTCFLIQERGKELPVKIAHVFVKHVALKGTGAAATLVVALKDDTSVVFKDFADSEAMTSALALLEHLADDGGNA